MTKSILIALGMFLAGAFEASAANADRTSKVDVKCNGYGSVVATEIVTLSLCSASNAAAGHPIKEMKGKKRRHTSSGAAST